jgi:hypothetical protein
MPAADAIEDPLTRRIVAFLEAVGIPVALETLPRETFLPGIDLRAGGLVVDMEKLEWPGDLLHEAGHIALTEPELRASLSRPSDDPGEEMAAIAWSYAASVALGLEPSVVFHERGYHGDSQALISNFTNGRDVGVPLLVCYGMAADSRRPDPNGPRPYPHMLRWLR